MTLSIAREHPTSTTTLLAARGAIDYETAPKLRAAISAATSHEPPPQRIVVDLRGVDYIDAAGVGTLVVGSRICRHIGIDLTVRNPAPLIRRLLGLASTGTSRPPPEPVCAARDLPRPTPGRSGRVTHLLGRRAPDSTTPPNRLRSVRGARRREGPTSRR